MKCDWCGIELEHPVHPDAAKYINPDTLQSQSSGQRFVFCSYGHKEMWLKSPIDICWICDKRLKTDSPLNECIIISGVEFYLCPIHRQQNWREEFNEKAKQAIEEFTEMGFIEVHFNEGKKN